MLAGELLGSLPSRESRVDEYRFSEAGSKDGRVWLQLTVVSDDCSIGVEDGLE